MIIISNQLQFGQSGFPFSPLIPSQRICSESHQFRLNSHAPNRSLFFPQTSQPLRELIQGLSLPTLPAYIPSKRHVLYRFRLALPMPTARGAILSRDGRVCADHRVHQDSAALGAGFNYHAVRPPSQSKMPHCRPDATGEAGRFPDRTSPP